VTIILRSDGTPIYNLAVVSDDIAMKNHARHARDDHISNTPKQILIYQALAADTRFAHLPMITEPTEEAQQAPRATASPTISISGFCRRRC